VLSAPLVAFSLPMHSNSQIKVSFVTFGAIAVVLLPREGKDDYVALHQEGWSGVSFLVSYIQNWRRFLKVYRVLFALKTRKSKKRYYRYRRPGCMLISSRAMVRAAACWEEEVGWWRWMWRWMWRWRFFDESCQTRRLAEAGVERLNGVRQNASRYRQGVCIDERRGVCVRQGADVGSGSLGV
jgi:hypothetical protein